MYAPQLPFGGVDALAPEFATKLTAKPASIRKIDKARLAETARKELGWTLAQAEACTLTELRKLIKCTFRCARETAQTFEDPFMKMPPGLAKMKKEDMITEMD